MFLLSHLFTTFLNLFTTITQQVIQLILIMLVGTDICVRMVFLWEETGVPGRNLPVRLGDHMTISHADVVYGTRVALVRCERVTTVPARQSTTSYFLSCYVFYPVYPFTTFSLPVFLSLSLSLFYLKHDAHVGATCKNHFGAGQAETLSGKSAYQLGLLKQEHFFRPICVDGPSTNTYVRPYCIIKPVAVKGACPSTHVENGSPSMENPLDRNMGCNANQGPTTGPCSPKPLAVKGACPSTYVENGSPTMENPFDRNMGCKANQGPTPGPCSPKHLSDVCESYVDKSANTSEMPSATKAPMFKWVSTSFQCLI